MRRPAGIIKRRRNRRGRHDGAGCNQDQRRAGGGMSWWQALLRFLIGGLWLFPAVYLHRAPGISVGLSLTAGLGVLLVILALRLPDRASETELVVLPKKP